MSSDDHMHATRMSEAQAAELRQLCEAAFEPDAFKPHLDAAEAARRIAALKAKLRLLDERSYSIDLTNEIDLSRVDISPYLRITCDSMQDNKPRPHCGGDKAVPLPTAIPALPH